jgi:drug/metabolite transporter (DMT)-like permease
MLKARRSELLLILSALMFASNGIASKLLLDDHISAWRLAQVRAIGASLFLAIYIWRKAPRNLRLTKAELPRLIALGAFGIAAVNGCYFLAISRMHVSMALLIEFTAPLWIVLYLRFIKRKYVPNQMWIALVLALTGLAFVAQIWDGLTLDGVGVIAAFASALAVAIYFVIGEGISKTRDGASITMWGFFFAAVTWCLLLPVWKFPFGVFTELIPLSGPFDHTSAPGWVLILYVICIGTIGPYMCTIIALKNLSASTTSTFGMLEPIFVGGIAWFWFGESWTVIQLIGGVIVIAGIYMADKAREKAN